MNDFKIDIAKDIVKLTAKFLEQQDITNEYLIDNRYEDAINNLKLQIQTLELISEIDEISRLSNI